MPMSATPSWARTEPSMYSTMEWTMDCGCTTTSICSGRRSKSHRASMISSPLFISVAESTVIFAPIFQVGWFRASAAVRGAGNVHVGEPLARQLAEGAAGGREHDAPHLRAVVPLEALEDGAVLGVHWKERHPAGPRARGHRFPGHHGRFLFRRRVVFPRLDGRHRRQQPRAPHEGGE